MPKLMKSLVATALLVLGVLAVLTPSAAQAGAKVSDRLVLTWSADGALQVDGFGYRPKGMVDIGLGSSPIQRAQADGTGRVSVAVPERYVTATRSGTSIVVTGRSTTGASRVLVSAVPPGTDVRGPVDVLPWSIAAAVAGLVALGALLRVRSRRRA